MEKELPISYNGNKEYFDILDIIKPLLYKKFEDDKNTDTKNTDKIIKNFITSIVEKLKKMNYDKKLITKKLFDTLFIILDKIHDDEIIINIEKIDDEHQYKTIVDKELDIDIDALLKQFDEIDQKHGKLGGKRTKRRRKRNKKSHKKRSSFKY